jgi:hypothetical protein
MNDSTPKILDLRKARGSKLIIFPLEGQDTLESQNLAVALEYVQRDSVRKMLTVDWSDQFREGTEYVIVRDPAVIKEFERDYADILGLEHGESKPARAARGRLFLLEPGVKKLLEHCSRPGVEAVRLALAKVFASFRAPDLEPIDPLVGQLQREASLDRDQIESQAIAIERLQNELGQASRLRSTVDLPPANQFQIEEVSSPTTSLEDRRFRYNALQTLLQQLGSLERPELRLLALEAAEVALDRSLPLIQRMLQDPGDRTRALEAGSDHPVIAATPGAQGSGGVSAADPIVSTTPAVARAGGLMSSPRTSLEGPRFHGQGWHSLTQIGEKAGGYSARTAGLAADVVASRMGLSRAQIRHASLNFNRMVKVRDTTRGKPRDVAHFNTDFSNDVIDELRRNPEFTPQVPPSVTSFGSGAFPKLTREVILSDD